MPRRGDSLGVDGPDRAQTRGVRRGTAGGCGRPGARSGRRRVLLLRIRESGARDAGRAVRRETRGGRDGVARRRRDTRGAHRDEDSDTVGTARRGRGEGCGRRRRALRRFSSNRRQKLFLGWTRIGRNCRCWFTHRCRRWARTASAATSPKAPSPWTQRRAIHPREPRQTRRHPHPALALPTELAPPGLIKMRSVSPPLTPPRSSPPRFEAA